MAQAEAESFAANSLHKTILENVEMLREQRAGLVNDVSRLNDELLGLSKRLEEVRKHHERELSALQSQKGSEQQELLFLRQEVTRLRGNVDGLEPVKRHLEASIADRQTQLNRLDSRMGEARSAVEEYATQIEQARSLWNEVVGRATEETRRLEAARAEVARLEPQRKETATLAEQLRSLKSEEATLQAHVAELTAADAELKVKTAALVAAYEERKREDLEFLRRQNEAELALRRAVLERDSLVSRNQELKKENESLEERIGQAQEKKVTLEQEAQGLQARVRTLHAAVEPLRQQVQLKEEEVRRLNGEAESVRGSLRDLASLLAEREKRLDVVNGKLEEIGAENRRLEGVIETLRSQEEGWRAKVLDGQKQLSSLRAEIDNGQRDLGALNTDLQRYRDLNERAALENAGLQEVLGQVQSELAETQRQKVRVHEELEAQRAERDARLSENRLLHEKISENERALRERQGECEARMLRVAELDGEIERKRSVAEILGRDLATMEERRQRELQEGEAATAMARELRMEIAQLERRVEELTNIQAGLLGAEERCTVLKREEESGQQALSNLRRTEKAIQSRIEVLEKQESGILERIDKSRAELSENERSHGSLLQKSTALEEKHDRISRNLEELVRKRDSVGELLKRDAEAVREARDQLRSLEDLKARKLKELEEIRADFAQLDRRREVELPAAEPHLRVTSAVVRAEAERTLETLRMHLGKVQRGPDDTDKDS